MTTEYETFVWAAGRTFTGKQVEATISTNLRLMTEISELNETIQAVRRLAYLPKDTPHAEIVAHLQRVAESWKDRGFARIRDDVESLQIACNIALEKAAATIELSSLPPDSGVYAADDRAYYAALVRGEKVAN